MRVVVGDVKPVSNVDDPNSRRILKEDDGVEVEILTPEEYKKIFGVEFDIADWTL